jgi:predicted nucleic acid-binding protein
MRCFPDTSFLWSLYRPQVNSPGAISFMRKLALPLCISSLLLLEFRQSVRLQVRLHAQDKTKGLKQAAGWQMLRDLQVDLSSGLMTAATVEWPLVHQRAEQISEQYTESMGHRLVDILHVATALQVGVDTFLTFDENQRILAKNVGLAVPVATSKIP